MPTLLPRCSLLLAVLLVGSAGLRAVESPDYETQIRPILKEHCTHCHGEEEKPKGGVDLRLRRFMDGKTEDGDPVLTPGDPEKSALWTLTRDGEMPKKGKKMPEHQLALLEAWIKAGAKISETEPTGPLPPGVYVSARDRRFWSFQPVMKPTLPRFADQPKLDPIDALVRAKLQDKQLDFAPEADRATLIRRATIDLTGLPPTPSEAAAFVADASPDAYAKLIERLLATPAYGERWARHWLDVAGYADTNGYADADSVRPHAWRFRDYVIRSLNADKPWDRFIQEQLAGDELNAVSAANVAAAVLDPAKIDALTATGYLRMGPDGTGDTVADAALAKNQSIADTLRIVTTSLTGLTVACAQCHDHRYDPISQVDYFRLRAVFDPALDWQKWQTPAQRTASLYSAADKAKAAEIEKQAAAIDAEATKMYKAALDVIFEQKILEVPEAERAAYRVARNLPVAKRTKEQAALIKKYFSSQATFGLDLYDKAADNKVIAKRAEATALRATKPIEGRVSVLIEPVNATPKSELHHRGDHGQLRQVVTPGELSILGNPAIPVDDPKLPTTGRRLAYAKWLTSGQHPLLGRTLMNRVWMHHFGRGIVNTPGDLGLLGERPSHPELLDYLAGRFVEAGWSLKTVHREMMLSRTYRQSARNDEAQSADPDNALFGRYRIRRLDAETIRDAMLAVSGKLNPEMYGEPVTVGKTGDGRMIPGVEIFNGNKTIVLKVDTSSPAVYRRSVYLQQRRSGPATALATFDLPNMDPNCERRDLTTVAPQSLFLMNDEFVIERAKDLAARVIKEHPADENAQVRAAWVLTQGRVPSAKELAGFNRLLAEQTEHFAKLKPVKPVADASLKIKPVKVKSTSKKAAPQPTFPAPTATTQDVRVEALGSLCQVLLATNRFLHVD
jgi:mono/diheme cytochrome c family protein